MKLPNPYTQHELAAARDLPPRNQPFAGINVGFHETYTRLVEQVLAQLGDSIPVIVLTGDDATLLCDGGKQREQVIPPRYHELKALAHLAFGVQLTLMANGSGRLTELTASELHEKRAQIREVQAATNAWSISASSSPMMKGPAELLCRAHALADRVLAEGAVDFERLEEHVRAVASHALETAQLAVWHRARTTARAPRTVAQRSWREALGRPVRRHLRRSPTEISGSSMPVLRAGSSPGRGLRR
jgi:hypothetical protein